MDSGTMQTPAVETRRPVTVGGRTWMIPRMAVKQLRLLQGKLDPLVKALVLENVPFATLTEQQIEDLGFCIWVAINRAEPSLTREEFDDLPTSIVELVVALVPISLQVAGNTPDKPLRVEPTEVEAQAAA